MGELGVHLIHSDTKGDALLSVLVAGRKLYTLIKPKVTGILVSPPSYMISCRIIVAVCLILPCHDCNIASRHVIVCYLLFLITYVA